MVEVSATVNNLGEGNLYNVTVYLSGDNVEESASYVGNVEPGKSGTADILAKASVVTDGAHTKNQMLITYEDKDGNVQEKSIEIDLRVKEPVYDNLEKVKTSKDHSAMVKKTGMVIVIMAGMAGIGYVVFRRRKRKQEILDEFIENGSNVE